jgi:carboxylate-amine ligase
MTLIEDHVTFEPLPHYFGVQPDFHLGIEEELLIVNPVQYGLEADAEALIAAASRTLAVEPAVGRLSSEIFAAELELITPISRSVPEAGRSLYRLLHCAHAAGATLMGSGLHPAASFGDAPLCRSPRYAMVSEALQGLLRTPPASLHVHVGMPDPETAIRVSNGLRRHLPLLHSLAANSPFWYGRDSGLASARAAVLRSYPRCGVPRFFRDWDEFSLVTRELAQAAGVDDYTYFWWEVRPHPRLGTVEVRAPDTQPCLERTLALAALIHSLARMEAEAYPHASGSRDALEEGCYQATRYGLSARLPDDEGAMRPAREMVADVLRRVAPFARELACGAEIEGIRRIVREGNGADLQRAVFARRGMTGLLTWLVEQRQATVGSVPARGLEPPV